MKLDTWSASTSATATSRPAPTAETYLEPGITFEALDAIAMAENDNQAARRVNAARETLFRSINTRQKTPAG